MLIFYSETLLKQFTNLSSSGWSLSVLSPHMHVYISLSCSNLNVFCFLHLFDYLWLGAAVLKRNWGVWSSFCLLDQEWTDFHHWPCHSLSLMASIALRCVVSILNLLKDISPERKLNTVKLYEFLVILDFQLQKCDESKLKIFIN